MKQVYRGALVRVMRRAPKHGMDDASYWVQCRNTASSAFWFDSFPPDRAQYQEPFYNADAAIAYAKSIDGATVRFRKLISEVINA